MCIHFLLNGHICNHQTITQTIHVKYDCYKCKGSAVVYTTTGVEAQLPQYATVSYSNRARKKVKIIWNNQIFNEAGKYTVLWASYISLHVKYQYE